MAEAKKKGLGRGLDALFDSAEEIALPDGDYQLEHLSIEKSSLASINLVNQWTKERFKNSPTLSKNKDS